MKPFTQLEFDTYHANIGSNIRECYETAKAAFEHAETDSLRQRFEDTARVLLLVQAYEHAIS
jgi:hypothetical protein